MELMLVTEGWPLVKVTEFLDEEIDFLCDTFDSVVVTPLYPDNYLRRELPVNLSVDLSLSETLSLRRRHRYDLSRYYCVASHSLTPRSLLELFRDHRFLSQSRKASWLKSYLIARAQFERVMSWAQYRQAPDVVYTFWLTSVAAALRVAWPAVPIVSRIHGVDLYSERQGWNTIPFQSLNIESVNLLAPVSQDGNRYLQNKFPQHTEKIVTRRLGVSDIGGSLSTSATRSTGTTPGEISVLSASTVTPVKRVPLIYRALRTLAADGNFVRWTHLGDGPELSLLEMVIRGEEVASFEIDLRGEVSLTEVHNEMASGRYDVFLNLSLSEGAPVSLMEAQCAGLPVVATDVGGTAEVASRDWNEIISPDSSISEICAAIIRAWRRGPAESSQRRNHWNKTFNSSVNYASWAQELRSHARR